MKELIDKIWNMPLESLLLTGATIVGVIVAVSIIAFFIIQIIFFKERNNKLKGT